PSPAAATRRPVLRPSCGACSTTRYTVNGRRRSGSRCDGRTVCGPPVTPSRVCSGLLDLLDENPDTLPALEERWPPGLRGRRSRCGESGSRAVPRSQQPERTYPVRLTHAQRKAVAEVAPEVTGRLKLEEPNQRTIEFTLAELKAIKAKAGAAA